MNIPARYCTGYLGGYRRAGLGRADGFRSLVRSLCRCRVVL